MILFITPPRNGGSIAFFFSLTIAFPSAELFVFALAVAFRVRELLVFALAVAEPIYYIFAPLIFLNDDDD